MDLIKRLQRAVRILGGLKAMVEDLSHSSTSSQRGEMESEDEGNDTDQNYNLKPRVASALARCAYEDGKALTLSTHTTSHSQLSFYREQPSRNRTPRRDSGFIFIGGGKGGGNIVHRLQSFKLACLLCSRHMSAALYVPPFFPSPSLPNNALSQNSLIITKYLFSGQPTADIQNDGGS